MSKKKVLDYDPKIGFGNFAEIMNANNAVDMAQNKVNTGMAPVTAPVANPAAPVTGAPMKLETPTPTPVVGDAVDVGGAVNGGETGGGAVSGGETNTGIGTNVGTTTEMGVTARPITSTPITSGPKQEEADWYAAQGLDPDKDYEEAKAALEYDYETSMATYGQRAEQLFQMGLSNSGVSDIYQLGAFNAYLASQNDLAYRRIEAKKKNKQAYLAYDKEYQAGVKADTANAYNFGLEQFDYEMDSDGKFTTNNAENIRAQLLSQGYDASIVDNVINMLTALDPTSLPTEKSQLQARKEAQEAKNKRIIDAFNDLSADYYPEQWNAIEQALIANNIAADEIEEIKNRLNNFYNSLPEDQKPDKIAAKNEVKDALDFVRDNNLYGKNIDEVKGILEAFDYSDEAINSVIAKLENLPQMVEETTIEFEGKEYSISTKILEQAKTLYEKLPENISLDNLKALLESAGLSGLTGADYEAIYADFKKINQTTQAIIDESNKATAEEQAEALINPIINGEKAYGTFTVAELTSGLEGMKTVFGADSDEYKAYLSKVGGEIQKVIDWALAGKDGTPLRLDSAEVASTFGFDASAWAEKDDAEREAAIIDFAGKMKKEGRLDAESYGNVLDNWIATETENIIKTDNDNIPATGMRDAGGLASTLYEYYRNGYLTNEEYGKRLDKVIEKMAFNIAKDGDEISIDWYEAVGTAEGKLDIDLGKEIKNEEEIAAVKGVRDEVVRRGHATNYKKINRSSQGETKTKGTLVWYNDSLYWVGSDYNASVNDRKVMKVNTDNMTMSGVGAVGYDSNQKFGIGEIFKRMIYNKQTTLERNQNK